MSGPLKRSLLIAGHATSVTLEPEFWQALRDIAASQDLSVGALVQRIDSERVARDGASNLSSAIRVYVLGWYRRGQPS